jgi:1-acyl-sn-glycerol-3-phosphate acyltransferase
VRGFILWLFRLRRWQLEGQRPAARRFVIVGAPHTSNWDFVFFIGATDHFGLRPRFMGKASLFRWPLTRFMFDMGGVPVDRSRRGNYAEAMIAALAGHDDFALVIAPEGTRSAVGKWRSGFWHIANGAKVPMVLAWVDNKTMRGGLGPEIMPSGDYEADMAKIAAFYRSVMPGHPAWAAFDAE